MNEIKSPLKAIRAKCIDCCGTMAEVKLCSVERCALYPFRFGKNPYRKPLSEEQRALLSERAKRNFAERQKRNDNNEN